MLVDPAHVDSAVFSTSDSPTSDLVTADQTGAADIVPVPVWLKNCLVLVIFPGSLVGTLDAPLYRRSPKVVKGEVSLLLKVFQSVELK